MTTVFLILFLFAAYLAGAIPFGYLLTKKSTGLNILFHGSGNIGSTNVGRIAGKKVAAVVQILDMLKGLVPVGFAFLFQKMELWEFPHYFIYLVAFATIIGHDFSIFLRFRGGKGVNTTLGSSFILAPLSVLCGVAAYFLVRIRVKFVSAGSLSLALAFFISSLLLYSDYVLWIYSLACSSLILVRHIPNLRRLSRGSELM